MLDPTLVKTVCGDAIAVLLVNHIAKLVNGPVTRLNLHLALKEAETDAVRDIQASVLPLPQGGEVFVHSNLFFGHN